MPSDGNESDFRRVLYGILMMLCSAIIGEDVMRCGGMRWIESGDATGECLFNRVLPGMVRG
jgi:hypothetical protein